MAAIFAEKNDVALTMAKQLKVGTVYLNKLE